MRNNFSVFAVKSEISPDRGGGNFKNSSVSELFRDRRERLALVNYKKNISFNLEW